MWLTRATLAFLHGNILMSIKYHFLAISFIISCGIYTLAALIGKNQNIDKFLIQHQKIIILLMICLLIFVEIININNDLLYG